MPEAAAASAAELMREIVDGAWDKGSFAAGASQIASKSIFREISTTEDLTGNDWTFSEQDMCTKAAALSYMTGALSIRAGRGRGAHDFLSAPTLRLARLWENLWKLNEGTPRGYALLNAACAYELAGYQANAACLSRIFEGGRRGGPGREPDLQDIASMFLQRRFVALRATCARLAAEPDYGNVGDMEYRLGTAAAASALSRLSAFFLSGEAGCIGAAVDDLSTAGRVFNQYGYHREAALLHAVRSLAAPMSSRSTWAILGDRARSHFAWNRYLLLLGRGLGSPVPEGRSISDLWPSQLDAVDGGLLESDASKIVRVPASSGKTRIAEMAMLKALAPGAGAAPARCVYVAPHGALVDKAAGSISAVFADLGFAVYGVDGAYDGGPSEEGVASRADIMVMTPEKLDLMLRAHADLLEAVGLFIFDEGHTIGDGPRGLKAELLLTRLKRRFSRARFILFSAVISDGTMRELSEWLSGSGDNAIKADWRPTRQRRARFEWSRAAGRGGDRRCMLVFDNPDGADRLSRSRVDAVIRRRRYPHHDPKTGRIVRPLFPSAEKGETAAELALKYSGLGPVLVYAARKSDALSVAKKLAYRLDLAAKAGDGAPPQFSRPAGADQPRSQGMAAERLGPGHDVARLLGRGIAVHNGDMPASLRRAVEEDVRGRRYAVIVATNTLSQGADIPARTVIVHSCRRCDPDTEAQRRIPDHEYWSLAGRAGRAGRETEGTVIHIVKTAADREDYDYYSGRRTHGAVRSRVCEMLLDLVRGRISDGAAEEAVDPEVLGMLAEEGMGGRCEDVIGDVVSGSLGALQVRNGAGAGVDADAGLERLRGRFLAVAGRAARLDGNAARAYGRTGMSMQSCETISSYVDENRDAVASLLSAGGHDDAVALALMALDAVDGLPEMDGVEQYGGDREELVRLWMGGSGVPEVCGSAGAADRGAAMLFIERYLGRFAPWGVSAFVRIAACRTGADESALPDAVRCLPDMVRYGVPNAKAAWAMRLGMPTRGAAMGVAGGYRGDPSFGEFAEWLAGLEDGEIARMCGPDAPPAGAAAALSMMRPNPLIREGRSLDDVLAMGASVACDGPAGRRAAAACSEGDAVEIRRDYDAIADRNAVAVYSGGALIGSMGRDMAQYLAPLIDCGLRLDASVDGSDGGTGGAGRIRILLRRAGRQ